MSVKWTTKITVTNLSNRDVQVTGTRTETVGEDVAVETIAIGATWKQGVTKGNFLTSVGNTIWESYQAQVARSEDVVEFLTNCETLLAGGLDVKETE